MQTVLIGSQPYDSYASVDEADAYLAASLHAGTDWSGASDTTKAQALATATRILDRQRWVDAYADADLATAQALRVVVINIVDACIEMALALVQGSDLQTEATTAQKLASIKAGSVALTYFRGAEGRPQRFPQIVAELLRDYLAGADLAVSPQATGVDGTSSTDDDFGHTRGF